MIKSGKFNVLYVIGFLMNQVCGTALVVINGIHLLPGEDVQIVAFSGTKQLACHVTKFLHTKVGII